MAFALGQFRDLGIATAEFDTLASGTQLSTLNLFFQLVYSDRMTGP